ncbi:MAG: hypothetical protein GXP63_04620 [DPANN group archaeon]|nr:hypothetical protein [DPANN group archaeon]
MRKKGYFFTIDAFIAMGILSIGLLLVISFRTDTSADLQTTFYSNDINNLFTSTELYTLNNRYIDRLHDDGNITNMRYTVLEQVGEFWFRNKTDLGRTLIVNLSYGNVGKAFSFAVLIENETIYNSSDDSATAADLFSSKKIISGVYNDTVLWGPYKAEVRVWR